MGEVSHGSHNGSALNARVLKALGVFSSTQALGILCNVARTKLVSVWIGTVGVGLFGIYSAAVELIATITQMSLRSSAVRDIAALPEGSARRRLMEAVTARWGVILGLLGMAVMAALSPLWSEVAFGRTDMWWAFVCLSPVMLMGSVTNSTQAAMQASGRLKALARASVWGALAALAASVPLIYFFRTEGIIPVVVIYSLATLTATLLQRAPKAQAAPRPSLAETWNIGRGFMRLGFYMTLSGAMVWGATFVLMGWLQRRGGAEAVGLYQAGSTMLIRYAGVLFTAIGMEYFPRIAAASHCRKRLGVYVWHEIVLLLRIAVPLAVAFIIFAPWIVELLYSPEFAPVVPYVVIGTVGLVARVAAWCMSFMMIARADGRLFATVEGISTILFLGLHMAGYTLWDVTGLGAAFTAWYLLYLAMVWGVCSVRYRLPLKPRAAALLLAALAIVSGCVVIFLAYTR